MCDINDTLKYLTKKSHCNFQNLGDSGGPMQTFYENSGLATVVGVTSLGDPNCTATIPGVYVKVSSYLDWIEDIVWQK